MKLPVLFLCRMGAKKNVRAEELTDYMTGKGIPKNIRGVRCARIEYPSPFLEKGMLLVDTPGVGSPFLPKSMSRKMVLNEMLERASSDGKPELRKGTL